MNGVILNGKRLRVEPRVDDPFFYKYQDMLAKFEHKTHTEPSFVESFMDEEQKKERDTLHEELSRSNSKWSSVRRRLGRYEDHWDLDPVMNPILKMDFFKRRHHHQQPYEQRSHSSDNPNRRHGNDSHYRQYEAPHRSTSYSNLPHYDSYDHRPQYNHRYSHYDRYQDNYGYHRPPGNPGRRFQPPPPPPPPPLQQHHHPYDERPPPPYRWHWPSKKRTFWFFFT